MVIVDYISDLHVDTYRDFKSWDKLNPQGEVLIIAGDLASENYTIKYFLQKLASQYSKVFYVLGNHELYCLDNKYNNYQAKIKSLKSLLKEVDKVELLDGNVVTYKGIRFGGAMGWYDGSFRNVPRNDVARIWATWSDAIYIKGLEAFDSLFEIEYNKLNAIKENVDVMITHFNPSNNDLHQNQYYLNDPCTSFFNFDGSKLLEKTSAKHWIYGHTHDIKNYKVNNCEVINNPYGYFNESKGRGLLSFNVKN
jgi:Icc-related predicted phosphoesterase